MVDTAKVSHWVIFGLCEELREKGLLSSADFGRAAARLRSQKEGRQFAHTADELEAAAKFLDSQAG